MEEIIDVTPNEKGVYEVKEVRKSKKKKRKKKQTRSTREELVQGFNFGLKIAEEIGKKLNIYI